MPNYIVDASVVIEYLISGPFTSNVQVFFNTISDDDTLTAPEFCLLECTNVIWKQVRFNNMPRSDAELLLQVLRVLKIRRAPMKRLLDRTLEIALNNRIAVYDAGYIALSVHYGYPLVSIDRQQIQAASNVGVTAVPIATFNA